jgi:hypothetical protein
MTVLEDLVNCWVHWRGGGRKGRKIGQKTEPERRVLEEYMIQHTWKIIVRNIYERHFLLKLVCCFCILESEEGICNKLTFFPLLPFF